MVFRLALAWGCSAREVLARINSRELAEWMAFERVHGPIDHVWRDGAMVELHYQLQLNNHLLGGAHFANEDQGVENPVPEPVRLPSPREAVNMKPVEQEF